MKINIETNQIKVFSREEIKITTHLSDYIKELIQNGLEKITEEEINNEKKYIIDQIFNNENNYIEKSYPCRYMIRIDNPYHIKEDNLSGLISNMRKIYITKVIIEELLEQKKINIVRSFQPDDYLTNGADSSLEIKYTGGGNEIVYIYSNLFNFGEYIINQKL